DDPENSSIKYASDAVPEKKTSDIALIGHAYAPDKTPASKISTGLQIGKLRKIVWATGDRFWRWSPIGITKTRPIPFLKIPLVYERAFGGKDTAHKQEKKHGVCVENPAGTGFAARKSRQTIADLKLPNFENKKNEIKSWRDKPVPAGYGFIGSHWMPRAGRIGDNPEQSDKEFFNAATPDLMYKNFLKGTESVILTNLHHDHKHIKFNLPNIKITASYIYEHQTYKLKTVLDTLTIEPDENL
ncbi:MAG: DUF2169 domain-containing protein, partial [Desulfobacteraceae bacterium]|nr:DUF2169 domain-containing protein [Desulfobacteraceae bacterium]